MKAILILTMMIPGFAFANWVGKSSVKAPSTVWSKKSRCESQEAEKCFEISGKDLRRWKAGFEMPVVTSTIDCDDAVDCQAKIDDDSFGCGSNPESFDDKANWPSLDFVAESRPDVGWFLWCQQDAMVADSAGSAAADAEDAQKASDKTARDNAKNQRLTDKEACVAAVNAAPALTPQDIKDCMNILVKEIFADQIDPADL